MTHWWLTFPHVAARGGFDVMLGNPPWEQLQLSEEEFFAQRAPSLAALAGDKRKKAIAELEESAPWLWGQFHATKRHYDATNLYFRAGGRFPLAAYGKLNTYALFSETFLQATRRSGRAGFIVPTGIATDDSTKKFFDAISNGRLVRLHDMRTGPGLFSEIGHQRYKFCLLTIGSAPSAEFAFFALRIEDLADTRRHFRLTPSEFALINPNTRTCPVFRSEHDAELTKKLYRAAPVLIEEAVVDEAGKVVQPEVNPWGITFSQGLFNMTSDSELFHNTPAAASQPPPLPLYEAKMIHQFDHRWATYVDGLDGKAGEVETMNVTPTQKTDPAFIVRPRYWVSERDVLARIADVPTKVARAWLELHATQDAAEREKRDTALAELLRGLAQWVAGELFRATAVAPLASESWSPSQAQPHIETVEVQLQSRFPRLSDVLRGEGLTTKKALSEFPKWAIQNSNTRLSDNELSVLADTLHVTPVESALLELLDGWMDHRSPRWLMGWRDICRSTDERTVIASVLPRIGVGHTMPLFFIQQPAAKNAALLGNWLSLTFDYVARTKVGGTHLTYGYLKQLPVLSPDRYVPADLEFIVPRVLELTYTADDMKYWADDIAAYDPRPLIERSQPFAWNPERRAQLRAELDAYYARLYGLKRDELRYILDPTDVMGMDYPSETFRVLRNNEFREFGEYRTQRLVLEAWDRQNAMQSQDASISLSTPVQYSAQGMIRSTEEAKLAGLIVALAEFRPEGCPVSGFQSLIAHSTIAAQYLEPVEGQQLTSLLDAHGTSSFVQLIDRVLPIVQRLEAVSVLVREQQGAASLFRRGRGAIPGDVTQLPEHTGIARLLFAAESRRVALEGTTTDDGSATDRSTGTR